MKIAVVHDRFGNCGGGERVALEIAKTLKADTIYTAYWEPEKTFEELKKFNIIEVNKLPDLRFEKTYALIRMLDAWKFSKIKELADYDLIWTSGMWAVFASKHNPMNIWYCHSPNRALYDLYEHFLNRYKGQPFVRWAFKTWANFWRKRDQKAIGYVKKIVANSENTRRRVQMAYNRDATVIHPPVDIKKFYHAESDGYWLSVQRIMPEKRVDLQIRIFQRLPNEKLIIVGKAEYGTWYERKITEMIRKTPNVEWLGRVDEKTLIDLYAHAKGVIQTAIDEDFGLVPVEAFAAGKPVLAVNEGGFRETVRLFTGKLINPPYLRNFVRAIIEFDRRDYNPNTIQNWAKNFSVEQFRTRIRRLSELVLATREYTPEEWWEEVWEIARKST